MYQVRSKADDIFIKEFDTWEEANSFCEKLEGCNDQAVYILDMDEPI